MTLETIYILRHGTAQTRIQHIPSLTANTRLQGELDQSRVVSIAPLRILHHTRTDTD